MSVKNERNMKWALEKAISNLQLQVIGLTEMGIKREVDDMRLAIDLLRNGGDPVSHSMDFKGFKCRWCDTYHAHSDLGDQCMTCGRLLNKQMKWTESWMEKEVLVISNERSGLHIEDKTGE